MSIILIIYEFFTFDYIVSFFNQCFELKIKGTSKIPVIALHSIFHFLIEEISLYKNCTLKPLGSHTASDRRSDRSGDIEIFDEKKLFEAIEVKLGRPITAHLMRIARDKIYKYKPRRYCIFTSKSTAEVDKQKVLEIKNEIFNSHGCQVILNGIIPTIKYYLRLLSFKGEFINNFMEKVICDSELTREHKKILENSFKAFF